MSRQGECRTIQLLRALAEPSSRMIVIYGMSGIGKTWIAKQSCNMSSSSFDIFIWVTLSDNCTIRSARDKILKRLSILSRYEDDEESGRQKIYESLNGRKFLLVLDDAWFKDEDDVLALLGVPRPNRGSGSKVIVTTRNSRSLSLMNPDVVIKPDFLTERESRELFYARADRDPLLSQVTLTLLKKCDGLPLSIILIAGAVRDVSCASEEDMLRSASHALGVQFVAIYTVSRAARFGYDMLPNDAVKCCLLYTVDIPAHTSVHANELIRHWWMNGLLGEYKGWEEIYTKGHDILRVLLEHEMLYKEGDGCVRMHNVVRDVVFDIKEGNHFSRGSVLNQEDRTLVVGSSSRGSDGTVSLMDGTLDEQRENIIVFHTPRLVFVAKHFRNAITDGFFHHMQTLRVLNLSNATIKLLPPSISGLAKLSVLILRYCESLEKLQHIGSLENLEVLDVSHSCSLRKIEPNSFHCMGALKVLNLSWTPIEILPSVAGLKELRQLFLSGCWCLREVPFPEDLTKLELLDLSNFPMVRFPYGILKLPNLKYLNLLGGKLKTVTGEVVLCSHGSYIPIKLVSNDGTLCISVSNAKFLSFHDEYPSWENSFQGFYFCVSPVMEEKINKDVLFQRRQIVFRESYFQSKDLAYSVKIGRYLEIHSIDSYPFEIEDLLRFSELVSFTDVRFMTRLSDIGLENLRNMRECWIEKCDNIESVFAGKEVERMAAIGSLENLWVSNLENLKSVCGGMEKATSFSCLKHLLIDCCPNLTTLFESAISLEQLETLNIKFCDQLESVFGETVRGDDMLPRLHKLKLWQLPELKSICGGILPALNSLQVKQCPKLKKLPLGVTEMSPLVRIKGEGSWWKNLVIEDDRIKPYSLFRKWGRF